MKIHNVAQNSVDWMILRAGVVTASEMDSIITPLWKARTGEGVMSYLSKKLAERWTGGPLPSGTFADADQGHFLEEFAKPYYELETGEKITSVGFITTDSGRVGCSPDGLLGDEGGIEIKCPHIETHIRYLIDGELPKEYAAQVHGSMFVTGRSWWKFMSYRRHFPPLILTIQRDEAIQEKISDALDYFIQSLDDAMEQLEKINGGPPSRFAPVTKPKFQPAPVALYEDDIIP